MIVNAVPEDDEARMADRPAQKRILRSQLVSATLIQVRCKAPDLGLYCLIASLHMPEAGV